MLFASLALSLSTPSIANAAPVNSAVSTSAGINLDGSPFVGAKSALAFNCLANTMCFYTGTNGSGTIYAISQNSTGCRTLPASVKNTTRSIYNNTGYNFHVYNGFSSSTCTDTGGTWATVWAHSTGNMNADWTNAIVRYKRV